MIHVILKRMNTISLTLRAIVLSTIITSYSVASANNEPLDDNCWTVSFEEPFNELSLWRDELGNTENNGLWRTRYIWGRETIINNEQQFYIDPEEHQYSPFDISDGVLSIVAEPTPRALRGVVEGQPYVSGVLTTEKSFAQQYGRFEVRAKVPEGQGFWPAFWLLPSFDRWPEGVAILPEIDVMEHLGHQPNVYHTTLHTNQTGELTSHPYDHTLPFSLTSDFHTYSVVWTAESVTWYLDGKWKASHPTPDDFTRPVHFLLNLAVGGNWPGSPDGSTEFPAKFMIDYVRAYTRNSNCS
jgi:beta-glucanase (GH16 family)